MKKIIVSIGLCLIGYVTMAQNVDDVNNAAYVNKRGVYLLPQAGDFALGIDATSFLEYLGNIFSSYNSAPDFGEQTIYGKYFIEDTRAIRARLSLGLSTTVHKGVVRNDAAFDLDPDSEATLFDAQRLSGSNVELGIGYEFRRGNGRVQGFCGGEFILGYGSEKEKYVYANAVQEDFLLPDFYDFGKNLVNITTGNPPTTTTIGRVTEVKPRRTFSVGLGTFAGVEYFFAPQMSLGGEFGLGFYFTSTGQAQTTRESWTTKTSGTVDEWQVQTDKSLNWGNARDFGINTRPSGRIFLTFHF